MTATELPLKTEPGEAASEVAGGPVPAAIRYRNATRAVYALTIAVLVFAGLIAMWLIGLDGPLR